MTHNFKAKLIRWPLERKSDDWQKTAFKWLVNINGQEFEYYAGVGHMEVDTQRLWQHYGIKDLTRLIDITKWDQFAKPTPPTLDDVLYCLISDANAADQSFDDWCCDYGYDTDSRKALDTYLECQSIAKKLRLAKIDINAERERLQDY